MTPGEFRMLIAGTIVLSCLFNSFWRAAFADPWIWSWKVKVIFLIALAVLGWEVAIAWATQ